MLNSRQLPLLGSKSTMYCELRKCMRRTRSDAKVSMNTLLINGALPDQGGRRLFVCRHVATSIHRYIHTCTNACIHARVHAQISAKNYIHKPHAETGPTLC